MERLRNLIERYPLAAFLALACGFSWSLWLLIVASARGSVPIYFPTAWLGSLGTFGASLAAIAVVALSRGRSGLKKLLRPTLRWRFGGRWWLFVIFGSLAVWTGVTLVANGLEGGAVLDTLGGDADPSAVRALTEGYLLIYNGSIAFVMTGLFVAVAGCATFATSVCRFARRPRPCPPSVPYAAILAVRRSL